MPQLVQYQQFTAEELKTPEGVAKLNQFLSDMVGQIHSLQGSTGTIKLDNDIDMQGKFKVINQRP